MAINIKPADRISNVSEYYFSKKLKEIAERGRQGHNIVRHRKPGHAAFRADYRGSMRRREKG